MSEPIVLHIRPTAEAAQYMLDHLGNHATDLGRIVALDQIARDLIAEIPAAEQRGYDRAVANLRDDAAFHAWRHPSPAPWQRKPAPSKPNLLAADYLDSIKEQP